MRFWIQMRQKEEREFSVGSGSSEACPTSEPPLPTQASHYFGVDYFCKQAMLIASVLLPTRTLTLKESIAIRDRPVSGRDAFLFLR